jgi:hypothetical protein
MVQMIAKYQLRILSQRKELLQAAERSIGEINKPLILVDLVLLS